jgi:hypothetical protein
MGSLRREWINDGEDGMGSAYYGNSDGDVSDYVYEDDHNYADGFLVRSMMTTTMDGIRTTL